jgi:transposase
MKPTPTPPPMAEQLVPDQIWDAIAPLLPAHPPQPKGGRPWISDRAVLGGLIDVLRSSTAWRLLPAKALGCGSRVTCWRRLRGWQQAGVWEQLHIGCWTG